MLDLNAHSTCEEEEMMMENPPKAFRGQMDDSGSSNSSVVNTEASSNGGDEDSCSTHTTRSSNGQLFAFNFDILKRDNSRTTVTVKDKNEILPSGFVTQQLFPVNGGTGGAGGLCLGPSSAPLSQQHCVDLSFCQADPVQPNVKIVQQDMRSNCLRC